MRGLGFWRGFALMLGSWEGLGVGDARRGGGDVGGGGVGVGVHRGRR